MCDTFVVMPNNTKNGSVIFGKNSDREPNEAQQIEYHPGSIYAKNQSLKCTYIEVPQAGKTNAVLISRPFWMWGAEIGANEKGVVIGNEAVFSKIHADKDKKLTGMDMLRIALERSNNAQNAMEIIIQHLTDFGQGGPCGFEDNLHYHNSYIIADSSEAWVLETVAHLWVAKKVTNYYAISNGYTIGEAFDLSHPDLIPYAQKKGWLKKGASFNFAECYSDWFYRTFTRCGMRRDASLNNLNSKNKFEVKDAFYALRDHGDSNYTPDSHFLMNHVCAHSGNKIARHASQSTASLVAELKNDNSTFWVTGTSAPCTSIFKPIRFYGKVLPDIGPDPIGVYTPNSLWWEHEKVHRTILQDFQKRHQLYDASRKDLELELYLESTYTKSDDFINLTNSAFKKAKLLDQTFLSELVNAPIEKKAKSSYNKYWKTQNRKANIII